MELEGGAVKLVDGCVDEVPYCLGDLERMGAPVVAVQRAAGKDWEVVGVLDACCEGVDDIEHLGSLVGHGAAGLVCSEI